MHVGELREMGCVCGGVVCGCKLLTVYRVYVNGYSKCVGVIGGSVGLLSNELSNLTETSS